METAYKIALDMDGVLAGFIPGICRHHGRLNPYLASKKHWGEFDTAKIWGMSYEEFWNGVDAQFWAQLPPTDDCFYILDRCVEFVGWDNIRLVTHPPAGALDCGQCVQGKIEWVEQWIPQLVDSFIFTKHKEWCADNNTILIDDNEKNIKNFFNAGGYTITVPQPWNSLGGRCRREHLDKSLEVYAELIKDSGKTR